MKTKLVPVLIALTIVALIASGCGDEEKSSDTGAGAPATTEPAPAPEATTQPSEPGGQDSSIKVPADASGQLKFEKDAITAKAGKVTLVMDNPSPIPHAVAIRADGQEQTGETVDKGGTSEVSAELKPGEYEFFCPVPGHEPAGMKGTLTVK